MGLPWKGKPGGKILVVDNDPETALTIKMELERKGISSDAFSDPLKALKHFGRHSDDYVLVLSDVRMPAMSGFKLVRRIRSIQPDTKIILMTSFEIDSSEFVRVFPSTKVDGLLQKPFAIPAVCNIIFNHSRPGDNWRDPEGHAS
jgi:CheY-like chemotaxis protein